MVGYIIVGIMLSIFFASLICGIEKHKEILELTQENLALETEYERQLRLLDIELEQERNKVRVLEKELEHERKIINCLERKLKW